MRLSFALLLLIVGCTAPDARDRAGRDLAAELAGRTPGPPQDCVSTTSTTNLRVVDEQTLTLERGGTIYVNTLMGSCPGLRPMDTLIVQMHGSQYCRGDRFRSRPFGGGAVPGPMCILGSFTPYRR